MLGGVCGIVWAVVVGWCCLLMPHQINAFHIHGFEQSHQAVIQQQDSIDLEQTDSPNSISIFPTSQAEMSGLNDRLARMAILHQKESATPQDIPEPVKDVVIHITKDIDDDSASVKLKLDRSTDPPSLNMKPGETLELSVHGDNANGYMWLRDHVPIVLEGFTSDSKVLKRMLQNQPTLVINQVQEKHSGIYQCVLVYNPPELSSKNASMSEERRLQLLNERAQKTAVYSKSIRVNVIKPPACPASSMKYYAPTAHCYWIPSVEKSFPEAESFCGKDSQAAHLTSFADEQELRFLRECVILNKDGAECSEAIKPGHGYVNPDAHDPLELFWTGLTSKVTGTSDNRDFSFTDNASVPKNQQLTDMSDTHVGECVALAHHVSASDDHKLLPVPCAARHKFICKTNMNSDAREIGAELPADRFSLGDCFRAMEKDPSFLTDTDFYVPGVCDYASSFCTNMQDGYCDKKEDWIEKEETAKAMELVKTQLTLFEPSRIPKTAALMVTYFGGDKTREDYENILKSEAPERDKLLHEIVKNHVVRKKNELRKSTQCRNNGVKCVYMLRTCYVDNPTAEAAFGQCWFDNCFMGAEAPFDIFDLRKSSVCELDSLSYYLSDFQGFKVGGFSKTNGTSYSVTLPYDNDYFRLITAAPTDCSVDILGPNDKSPFRITNGQFSRLYNHEDIFFNGTFKIEVIPPNPAARHCWYWVNVFRDQLAHDVRIQNLRIPEVPDFKFDSQFDTYDSLIVPMHVGRIHILVNENVGTPAVPSFSVNGLQPYADSNAVPLIPGPNRIEMRMVAQDGHFGQTFTFVIEREYRLPIDLTLAHEDARLSRLSLWAGTQPLRLEPVFDPDWPLYSVNVTQANSVSPIVSAEDKNAVITINGVACSPSHRFADMPLLSGPNVIQVVVRAEDYRVASTYSITLYRPIAPTILKNHIPSSAAALEEIEIVTPRFYPDMIISDPDLAIERNVPSGVDRLYLKVKVRQPGCIVTINNDAVFNGLVPEDVAKPAVRQLLRYGNNKFRIIVFIPAINKEEEHVLVVTRAYPAPSSGASTVAVLSSIQYSSGRMLTWDSTLNSLSFENPSTLYEGLVSSKIDMLCIKATATAPNMRIEIEGSSVPSGSLSPPIPFPIKDKYILVHIKTVPENGDEKLSKRYVVKFRRASEDASLDLFFVKISDLDQPIVSVAELLDPEIIREYVFNPKNKVAANGNELAYRTDVDGQALVIGLKTDSMATVTTVEGPKLFQTIHSSHTDIENEFGPDETSRTTLEGHKFQGMYLTPLPAPACTECGSASGVTCSGARLKLQDHFCTRDHTRRDGADPPVIVVRDQPISIKLQVQAEDINVVHTYRILITPAGVVSHSLATSFTNVLKLAPVTFSIAPARGRFSALPLPTDYLNLFPGVHVSHVYPPITDADADLTSVKELNTLGPQLVITFNMIITHLFVPIWKALEAGPLRILASPTDSSRSLLINDKVRPVVHPHLSDPASLIISFDTSESTNVDWIFQESQAVLEISLDASLKHLFDTDLPVLLVPRRPSLAVKQAVIDISPFLNQHYLLLSWTHRIDRLSISHERKQSVVLQLWRAAGNSSVIEHIKPKASDTLRLTMDSELPKAQIAEMKDSAATVSSATKQQSATQHGVTGFASVLSTDMLYRFRQLRNLAYNTYNEMKHKPEDCVSIQMSVFHTFDLWARDHSIEPSEFATLKALLNCPSSTDWDVFFSEVDLLINRLFHVAPESEKWVHTVYTSASKLSFHLNRPDILAIDISGATNILRELREAAIAGVTDQLVLTAKLDGYGLTDVHGQVIGPTSDIVLTNDQTSKNFFQFGDTINGCLCNPNHVECSGLDSGPRYAYGCSRTQISRAAQYDPIGVQVGRCILIDEHLTFNNGLTKCGELVASPSAFCQQGGVSTCGSIHCSQSRSSRTPVKHSLPWDECRINSHIHDPHETPVDEHGYVQGFWASRDDGSLTSGSKKHPEGSMRYSADLVGSKMELQAAAVILSHPQNTMLPLAKAGSNKNKAVCDWDNPNVVIYRPSKATPTKVYTCAQLALTSPDTCDEIDAYLCPNTCKLCAGMMIMSAITIELPADTWKYKVFSGTSATSRHSEVRHLHGLLYSTATVYSFDILPSSDSNLCDKRPNWQPFASANVKLVSKGRETESLQGRTELSDMSLMTGDFASCSLTSNWGKHCDALVPDFDLIEESAIPFFTEKFKLGVCHGCCHSQTLFSLQHVSMQNYWLMFDDIQDTSHAVQLQCLYKSDMTFENLVWRDGRIFSEDSHFCSAALLECGRCVFPRSDSDTGTFILPPEIVGPENIIRFEVQADSQKHRKFSIVEVQSGKVIGTTFESPLAGYSIKCLDNTWRSEITEQSFALSLNGNSVNPIIHPHEEFDVDILGDLAVVVTEFEYFLSLEEQICKNGFPKLWKSPKDIDLGITLQRVSSDSTPTSIPAKMSFTITWAPPKFAPMHMALNIVAKTVEKDYRSSLLFTFSPKDPKDVVSELVRPTFEPHSESIV
eukprot:c13060_g1_i1.p1 GENE.c13060_g1_i1~~c13060_g1_i1.p1  ORF type:complete len:2503 (-),score=580.67 c13060_g1_i1:286-7794(-)